MSNFAAIEALARATGFRSYAHYLQSDHWGTLKKQKKTGVGCCVCSEPNNINLVVHHIRYRDLLNVELGDLVVMCGSCHSDFHAACRKHQIDYIDKEIPAIIKITELFQWQEERIKCLENTTNSFTNRRIREPIIKQFEAYLAGDVTDSRTMALCEWLVEHVSAFPFLGHPITEEIARLKEQLKALLIEFDNAD